MERTGIDRGKLNLQGDQDDVQLHGIDFDLRFVDGRNLVALRFYVIGTVVAATFGLILFIGVIRAVKGAVLQILLRMAGFCLHKKGYILELVLAVMRVQHKAGGAKEDDQRQYDMCSSVDQMV